MGHALGNTLPLAVGIAVFPIPIIAAVLLVASPRGDAKGLAFALAWAAGLGGVGALVLVLAGVLDARTGDEPATWVSVVLLVVGVLLLAAAVSQWRGRPATGDEPPTPAWMQKLSDLTPARAAGAGLALSGLNPKNILLMAAAAAEIAEAGLAGGQEIVVLVVFVVIASAGVLTPLVLSLALGERSRAMLDGLKAWLARHNAAIISVIFVAIGAKLIGDAISGFSQ